MAVTITPCITAVLSKRSKKKKENKRLALEVRNGVTETCRQNGDPHHDVSLQFAVRRERNARGIKAADCRQEKKKGKSIDSHCKTSKVVEYGKKKQYSLKPRSVAWEFAPRLTAR